LLLCKHQLFTTAQAKYLKWLLKQQGELTLDLWGLSKSRKGTQSCAQTLSSHEKRVWWLLSNLLVVPSCSI